MYIYIYIQNIYIYIIYIYTQCGAPKEAKLVNITTISLFLMVAMRIV